MLKKFTLLLFFLSLACSVYPQSADENIVPGEILVQFKPGYSTSSFVQQFHFLNSEGYELLSDVWNIYLFKYDPAKIELDEIIFTVKQYPSVKQAQFNHYIQERTGVVEEVYNAVGQLISSNRAVPNDPRFNEQWALNNTGQSGGVPGADIDAIAAWDFSTGGITALGDTIVLAIVDGGCQLDHPDLQYWYNWDEIPGNGIDDDGNGYIDDHRGWDAINQNGNVPSNGHGTHVSGISAAQGNNALGVTGVNWNAKVMPIRGSSGTESVVVRAYTYVLKERRLYNQTNGAQGSFVVATNASFGVDNANPNNYPLWCGIYDSLGVEGILSAGATANNNVNVDVVGDVPTACPSPYMVSVTNTTNQDVKNSGAAYGLTTIDLGAPGTAVLSTYTSSGYSSLTGTSMATPQVTGAIGLMFAAANTGLIQAYKANPASVALQFRDFMFAAVDTLPSLVGKTVTGGRLNIFKALMAVGTEPDTIPPTTITDLSIVDQTSNSVTLSWTVPMDTTRNGIVAYDVRMSTSAITDSASFYNAAQVSFPGSPDTTGATETMVVDGLNFTTQYYFAVKSSDLWGNLSAMSNNPSGTTWGAPVISATPSSLHHVLGPNNVVVDSIILSNISSGNSTLDYTVSLENNTFPGGFSLRLIGLDDNGSIEMNDNKDNPEKFYGSSFRGKGGPDNFGYEWIDSNEPDGPAYVWNDIASTGTAVTSWVPTGTYDPRDEGYAGPFPFGFNFKYYGNVKTEIYVSSNGFLHFAPLTANTITNATIPNSAVPNELIVPFWDDLDGRTQGTVHYQADADKFTLQFTNWQKYSATGSLTFQVVLYPSGKIMFYYNNMNATLTSATVGFENAQGNDGLQIAYNAAYVQNNLAVKIAAEPDWLQANTAGGTLYNNNSVKLELTYRAEDFPEGNYSMDVVFTSNDPVNDSLIVPVTMELIVPVELTSFSAFSNKNSATLSWTTATEINNSGFNVERKNSSDTWEQISFVEGRGNSTEINSYSYTDNNLKPGKYSYRLKQVDYDGTFEYSKEVALEVGIPKEYSLFQNYPNPFNPSTTIEYSLPQNSDVVIEIYSALGELVSTLVKGTMEAGYHQVSFDASQYTSGTYIYRLTAKNDKSNYSQTKKMLLIK